MDVWVGRCGAQTLTLFKTKIFDFPTLFKTASGFLRPHINTFNQNSLFSFVLGRASGISANIKKVQFRLCVQFLQILSVRISR